MIAIVQSDSHLAVDVTRALLTAKVAPNVNVVNPVCGTDHAVQLLSAIDSKLTSDYFKSLFGGTQMQSGNSILLAACKKGYARMVDCLLSTAPVTNISFEHAVVCALKNSPRMLLRLHGRVFAKLIFYRRKQMRAFF